MTAPSTEPLVYVVDDDAGVREAIRGLLRSVGLRCEAFATPEDFLRTERHEGPRCLVLDLQLPGRSGLEVQRALAESQAHLPIIFVTGHGDIPTTVQAMKSGAVEFLTKPFRDEDLLAAIEAALTRDGIWLAEQRELDAIQARFATLSPREQEVMSLVVTGKANKQIAAELGISEITVKMHRGKAMRKMAADSLADLVRLSGKLGLSG